MHVYISNFSLHKEEVNEEGEDSNTQNKAEVVTERKISLLHQRFLVQKSGTSNLNTTVSTDIAMQSLQLSWLRWYHQTSTCHINNPQKQKSQQACDHLYNLVNTISVAEI